MLFVCFIDSPEHSAALATPERNTGMVRVSELHHNQKECYMKRSNSICLYYKRSSDEPITVTFEMLVIGYFLVQKKKKGIFTCHS